MLDRLCAGKPVCRQVPGVQNVILGDLSLQNQLGRFLRTNLNEPERMLKSTPFVGFMPPLFPRRKQNTDPWPATLSNPSAPSLWNRLR
jgi:hypothetical protein